MNLGELRGDLNNRVSSAKITGFWTDDMKDQWINQAGQRVCDFRRWKWLELALETQTRSGKEYYDYPEAPNAFKRDSIYQIDIEGEEYDSDQSGRSRVNWTQFQKAKQSGSEKKIFANHNGFYFLHPVPADGKVMSLYGLKTWRTLESDEDEPITPAEVYDEAIVRIALATCLRKAKRYNEAKAELVEILDPRVGVLENLWEQENDESALGYGGEAKSSRW